MVTPKVGDIFKSKAQTLVNTVNCVGVMGKGIALGFKDRFPDMYADYVERCQAGKVRLGEPYLFKRKTLPWIINFPTKDHWRSVSKLSDIVRGLEFMLAHYEEWGVQSLAVPPLGCGQGQLDWEVVGPTLFQYLNRMNVPVELYAPHGTPPEQLRMEFLQRGARPFAKSTQPKPFAKIMPAWVALAQIVNQILREPHHWPVGRTTFQKIAYFATELGLPSGLTYSAGSYGPFSPDVKGLLTALVNNGILDEEPLGRMLSLRPGPTFKDASERFADDLNRWEHLTARVTDLFLRIRTHEAEVAATVYFAARSLKAKTSTEPSEIEVLEEVKRWKQRRHPPLNEQEVASTIRGLAALHWLEVKPSKDLPVPEDALSNA
jgi:O-acetyl-ADP-ribose deacetylase (regulator of RNase III)